MEGSDTKSIDKKRLILFLVITYGISYLMMIPLSIGKMRGLDLTQLVTAQMCSPAAAVALGFIVFLKGEKRVPKLFMVSLVLNYIFQLVLGLLSIFANPFGPEDVIDLYKLSGTTAVDPSLAGTAVIELGKIYNYVGQYVLIIFSIILWIGYFIARKEKRQFAGLSRNNEKKGLFLVLLFIVLYILRIFIPMIVEGVATNTLADYANEYAELTKNPLFYFSIVSLPINYPLIIIAFLGEEYGWRYFFQPIMQKKFGMKLGVILLGVLWGLWHVPVDTLYYTEDSIPQMIVGQIITCVFIGIFFGYAYLKTNNIWVPVALHYLNNNLIPILTGTFSADVLENQHVPWFSLVEILIVDILLFGVFIFAKEYKEKKETKTEVADA